MGKATALFRLNGGRKPGVGPRNEKNGRASVKSAVGPKLGRSGMRQKKVARKGGDYTNPNRSVEFEKKKDLMDRNKPGGVHRPRKDWGVVSFKRKSERSREKNFVHGHARTLAAIKENDAQRKTGGKDAKQDRNRQNWKKKQSKDPFKTQEAKGCGQNGGSAGVHQGRAER